MFVTLAAVAITFLTLPGANDRTAPWIATHILSGYGGQHLENGLLFWKVLLAFLIFASVRAVFKLAFSAASLALALRLVSFIRER